MESDWWTDDPTPTVLSFGGVLDTTRIVRLGVLPENTTYPTATTASRARNSSRYFSQLEPLDFFVCLLWVGEDGPGPKRSVWTGGGAS